MPSKRQRKKLKRCYIVTRVEALPPTPLSITKETVYRRQYLKYNPANPELATNTYATPLGVNVGMLTYFQGALQYATKFRTVVDATAIALQYGGAVVRYNGDNRSWSELSDFELGGGCG